jgi:CRISPR-associated endonuclease Csn1
MPYRLRNEALDRKLELVDLGRTFYHLAQRRGFLSNRKSLKKDEDEGIVQQGITELQAAMTAAGARTLGQYFAGLDPETERIRRRWTARSMYIDEFNQIWDAQSPHHPGILTDALRKELFRAIFFQRPLKSARHLIGRCELVPNARRAALGDRCFQEFRILQNVNNLQIIPPGASPRPLDDEQRAKIIAALCRNGDLTFAKIKSVLGLPRSTELKAWGRDDEKKLPGHRTDQKMRTVFGDRWDQMHDSERDSIVLEVMSFQNPDALARRAVKAWGLDDQAAKKLAEERVEQGYASHSRHANGENPCAGPFLAGP